MGARNIGSQIQILKYDQCSNGYRFCIINNTIIISGIPLEVLDDDLLPTVSSLQLLPPNPLERVTRYEGKGFQKPDLSSSTQRNLAPALPLTQRDLDTALPIPLRELNLIPALREWDFKNLNIALSLRERELSVALPKVLRSLY